MKICIDTETTGLMPGTDEILQVSIVNSAGTVLLNEYIQPERATEWTEAERVNHITPDMVAGCQHIAAFLPRINAICAEAEVIAGYGIYFDLAFLKAAGVAVPDRAKIVDVMEVYSIVAGDWDEKKERFKRKKLIECAEHYGYEWPGVPHDSLQDALATIFCWPRTEADLMP